MMTAAFAISLAIPLAMSLPASPAYAQGTPQQQGATAKPAEAKSKASESRSKADNKKTNAKDGRAAQHARQKQCGAEWKKAKADNKVEKGMTWPKFYSACNKRLKEKAA
jgi:hypothetical protein